MKITMALCFGVATAAWMTVARRRLPSAAAIGAVGCMVISLPLVSWANLVGSDLPYLAVVGITVAAFARWTTSPVIGRHHAVALGALTALAFAFRQEGLLLLLAVLVAAVAPQLLRSRSRAGLRVTAARCGAITGVFLTLTLALHLVLPSQVLPRYAEAGLGQVRSNLRFFGRTVGAQFGVYDAAHQRVAAVGSPLLGWLVAVLIVTLISLGTLRMIARHDALDVLLLGTAAAHAFGALTFPYPDGRYMFVAVVVADLALGQGVSIVAIWIAGHVPAGRVRVWHTAAIVAVIAGVAIGVQIPPYRDAALGASEARRIDLPAFSPYEPTAQAMFEAVRASTLPDDVVAFIHARAMTLFTDRRSVQIRPTDAVPAEARW